MRVIAIILSVLSLISCNFVFPDEITNEYGKNPFLDGYDISKNRENGSQQVGFSSLSKIDEKRDSIHFVAITDIHIGRTDSNIKRFDDNFISYLESNTPEFVLCLGDLSDNGKYSEEMQIFIDKASQRETNEKGWFVYCIGNHERHIFDDYKWDNTNSNSNDLGFDLKHFSGTMDRYSYGDILSIYKLDSSMRALGQQQLYWLEEALKQDPAKYKMIISHDNITTGGALDHSLFLTGFADIQERNKLYHLLDKYNVGVVLSGHHHKGNIEYHMNDFMGELNLAAYHQRKTFIDFESEGYFYDCVLDVNSGKLTINGYLAEYTRDNSRTPDKTFTFMLPSSR